MRVIVTEGVHRGAYGTVVAAGGGLIVVAITGEREPVTLPASAVAGRERPTPVPGLLP